MSAAMIPVAQVIASYSNLYPFELFFIPLQISPMNDL